MELVFQIILAVIIIGVLAAILHCGKKLATLPVPLEEGSSLEVVIKAEGDGAGLQQTVAGVEWLVENGTLPARIVIEDRGLSAQGRKAAEIICRDKVASSRLWRQIAQDMAPHYPEVTTDYMLSLIHI